MTRPGGGARPLRRKSNRTYTGNALFRPLELKQRGRHATAEDLRLMRGLLYRRRGELAQRAAALELEPTDVALLFILTALPRPQGRPLGVGLQLAAAELGAVLGCCERTVHNVRARLVERGLLRHAAELRTVAAITSARPREQRLRHFYGWVGRKLRKYEWAHVQAVDYPTPRALTLLDHHRREGSRGDPQGLWITLRKAFAIRLGRFSDSAPAPDQRCTPYNSGDDLQRPPAQQISEPRSTAPPVEKPVVRAVAREIGSPDGSGPPRLPGGRSGKSRRPPPPPPAAPAASGRYGEWLRRTQELRDLELNLRDQLRVVAPELADWRESLRVQLRDVWRAQAGVRYEGRMFRRRPR